MNSREKSVKIFWCIVELHDKSFDWLFQCQVRFGHDVSRLVYNGLHLELVHVYMYIYSWTSPMMKFVMDEMRSVESVTNYTLEEYINIFIMQLNNALKYFYTFSQELIQLLLLLAL